MYDYIVIGSGFGGLSAAAMLARESFSVLTLESHVEIGGCASFFKRKGFTFDVGATTYSGIKKDQPLGKLFDKLDIKPKLKKIDPGMIIFLNDKKIIRYADNQKWIEEAEKNFGKNQEKFWSKIFELEEMAWQLSINNPELPPKNLLTLLKLAKINNLRYLKLLPGLIKPVYDLLLKYQLENNQEFISFLDEQLLISTQNITKNTPYLTGAMGLAYPSETYYPYGGMYKPAKLIQKYIEAKGQEIKFKEKVISIISEKDYYIVKSTKNSYKTKAVIANIPIWNMPKITEGIIHQYFSKKSKNFKAVWGAFTIYFAVKADFIIESAYYQIHCPDIIPFCHSKSFFTSFSLEDDREKAPEGWLTVTISTHTKLSFWENISKEEYQKRKQISEEYILKEFDRYFPDNQKLFLNSGTPSTFEYYTQRHRGSVGGIPHSVDKSLLSMESGISPFPNLYLVGDTVFPGQGTPAVVMGALNITERIIRGKN